ncbi:ceramidase domain-containing protein [Candidatus Venteria ishoeyi]|uniref:ceramidase domain-containing protein n=1 Tax=Candidatus Venteria ishoeyi TaxID=1899563 RepID=UPI0025A60E3B|nr:ceramidase domain-containing protein [Candidatus Venteria ishoeyi]MDM8545962.1 ceramidase domain-containing protein [Candidatus Venteria ishoeyi]
MMSAKNKETLGFSLIFVFLLFALIVLFSQNPIAQDLSYHLFKDTREISGVPNFWNVFSNLPFLLLGLLGLYKINKLQLVSDLKIAYILLFMGSALVALGSAYYHLWPNNQTLVWDRLPMTIAFMALFSIIIAEFISIRLGRWLLWPLILLGMASVVYWHLTESWGQGDLRYYALVQFFPILAIPVILLCFRPSYTRVFAYWWLLLAYLLAKLFEMLDAEIYQILPVSGHSLKHVLAALGLYILLKAYEQRHLTTAERET